VLSSLETFSRRNAEEYALCERAWELSAAAAEGLDREVRVRSSYRRRAVGGIAALASAALIVLTVSWLMPPAPTVWRTGPGEQRTLALEDGSRITMNTRSTLEVRIDRSKREIRMQGGEAFYEVAKDESRPFVVETSLGTARAVGTRFNVLVDGDRVEVATEEGKVLVQTLDRSGAGVLATAGTRATLVHGEFRPALDRADLTRIENWRARRLEFDRVPLDAALKEFSRYTPVPIRAGSPDVGQIYVSAVLKVGDVDALRATLKGAFGLTVVAGRDEWLVTAPDAR
jgi:transmembrane sensor